MSNFEFVSVLMSIVVGLGITRILSHLATLLEYRERITLDGVTLVWTLNVLGFHLIYWWVVVNNWRTQATWSFGGFVALFLYGVALYFAAALILPRVTAAGLDLRRRFEIIRVPFFSAWLAVLLLETLDSFRKGAQYVISELGPLYLLLIGTSLILGVMATRVSSGRFHWIYALGTTLAFSLWVAFRFSLIQP